MPSEFKDILDYNVTLGALRAILNILLTEKQVDMDFLRRNVAINKFDLIDHSINFLKKLQVVKISSKYVISNISPDDLGTLRAVIINRFTVSNDPYIRYLISFLDNFLSAKEYYEPGQVWHMLANARSKENVKSPREELSFKFRMLIRHLKELGLAITFKKFIIPIVDPSLILEIVNNMQFSRGSIYELMSNIRNRYLPCCDHYGKPYGPIVKSFESLESLGFLKLSSKSDAGLEYSIGGKKCNFLEVIKLEN